MSVLAAAGARLRLVAITDGEASHPGAAEPSALARRRVAETGRRCAFWVRSRPR